MKRVIIAGAVFGENGFHIFGQREERHGIRINDLYSMTKEFSKEEALVAGDVHFKESGSRKLAAQVAEEILQELKP